MAHDTHFKNGLAYGPYNNFYATSANVFAVGDTTPDVTDGCLFYSNNSVNTTITHFDLTSVGGGAGSNAGEFEGKVIRVILLDDSTRLVNGGRLLLNGSNGLQGLNNSLELIYHNSSWIEFGRSYNQSNVLTIDSNSLKTASSIFPNPNTGNIIVTGRGTNLVFKLIAETTTPIAIRRVIGGEEGTQLTFIAAGGSHNQIIVNSAAADTFISTSSASSTSIRLVSSAAITFVYNNLRWHEITPIQVSSGTAVSGV